MRTLERFLHRRRIKDVNIWLRNMNIDSEEKLAIWCKNNDIIVPPAGTVFNVQQPEESADEKEATWHTPAAERPRKATTKKAPKAKAKPKRTTKK